MADDADGGAPRNNGGETPKRKMPEGRPFQPGNPGRPKGSRNKLGEHFIAALHDDFQAHGVKAIEAVRTEKPHEYLKVIASILPKQLEIKDSAFDGISDEQLSAIVAAAAAALGVAEDGESGTATAH